MEKLEVVGLNHGPIDNKYYVDYNARNHLVQYVWGQAASLTCALSERGIYHRDVDTELQLHDSDAGPAPGAAGLR